MRFADDSVQVMGMAYRLDHDGPFDMQADEIMYAEFAHPADVLKRIREEPFCPDGLHVFQQYLRQAMQEQAQPDEPEILDPFRPAV